MLQRNFAAGSALGYDTTAANRTIGSAITTTLGLGKTGTNTLTLTGNNSTGAVILLGGTLAGSVASDSLTGSSYDVRTGTISISLGGASSTLTKTITGQPLVSLAATATAD